VNVYSGTNLNIQISSNYGRDNSIPQHISKVFYLGFNLVPNRIHKNDRSEISEKTVIPVKISLFNYLGFSKYL